MVGQSGMGVVTCEASLAPRSAADLREQRPGQDHRAPAGRAVPPVHRRHRPVVPGRGAGGDTAGARPPQLPPHRHSGGGVRGVGVQPPGYCSSSSCCTRCVVLRLPIRPPCAISLPRDQTCITLLHRCDGLLVKVMPQRSRQLAGGGGNTGSVSSEVDWLELLWMTSLACWRAAVTGLRQLLLPALCHISTQCAATLRTSV